MSELFDKSIRTLELPRVLQLLSEQAVSPEAKELALAVRPETDYEDVLQPAGPDRRRTGHDRPRGARVFPVSSR